MFPDCVCVCVHRFICFNIVDYPYASHWSHGMRHCSFVKHCTNNVFNIMFLVTVFQFYITYIHFFLIKISLF